MDKERQMYQLHKKGYEDIAKAISKAVTVRVDGSEVHLEAPKGEPGKDGRTPVKGVDYFTKDEVDDIVQEVFSKIPTPKDGQDGIVDYDKVSQFIKSEISKIKIPKPQDGKDAVVDYGSIINAVLKQIPVPEEVDYTEVRKYIEKSVEKTRMTIRPLVSGGPTTMLGTIADVRVDGATAGQVLTYDGSKWVATDASGGGAVDSVNGQTGVVVLDADDIDDTSTTNKFVTSGEKTAISTALQSGDNVSALTNDAGYLTDVDIADINATGTPSSSTFLRGDGTWNTPGGGGTVTSVSATVPTGLTISGSPITGSGTLAIGLDTGRVIPTQATIDGKQATLVSGTNIKTVNSTTLLGAGNIAITPNATHTGDVTGATALTIANSAVTNAKMANMATKTYKGRTVAGTGAPADVPVATLKTDLALVKGDVGLGNVDNTSNATERAATATLTNKTITDSTNNVTANGLRSATTTVSVSGATAPTSGQVLTATSGTTATWQDVGGGGSTLKAGIVSKNLADASGTQTIAHGLGATPTIVKLTAMTGKASDTIDFSYGIFNSDGNRCVYTASRVGNNTETGIGTSETVSIFFSDVSSGGFATTNQSGVVTVDATNITITWTKAGSPTGTKSFMWEAQ